MLRLSKIANVAVAKAKAKAEAKAKAKANVVAAVTTELQALLRRRR